MKRIPSMLAAMFLMAAISFSVATPVYAVSSFSDVALDSPYQDSIEYLQNNGIVCGIGKNQFSPGTPLTVRQWAIMLCRAYGLEEHCAETPDFGLSCVEQCLKNGWLSITSYSAPDTRICWASLLESAFNVIGLPIYNYELYPDGEQLDPQENLLRIGMELGLCEQDTKALQLSTRGEAALLLCRLLTQAFEVTPPPSPIDIQNPAGVSLNSYQLELRRVPQAIFQTFQSLGWSYTIDMEYLEQYSRENGMSCIGLTDYRKKQIIISEPSTTLHEIGHFLHSVIDFSEEFEELYRKESPAAEKLLRQYALTNAHEYFADCFAYWISYHENTSRMERFQAILPETYQFFAALEEDNWGCGLLLRAA